MTRPAHVPETKPEATATPTPAARRLRRPRPSCRNPKRRHLPTANHYQRERLQRDRYAAGSAAGEIADVVTRTFVAKILNGQWLRLKVVEALAQIPREEAP